MRATAALLGMVACAAPTLEASEPAAVDWLAVDWPAVADLPEVADPPDPFVSWLDGAPVSPTDWPGERSDELRALFQRYLYGWSADTEPADAVVEVERGLIDGGQRRQWTARAGDRDFTVVAYLPSGPGPHDVFLGLNKCGNRSVRDDVALLDGGGWAEPSCDPTPGSRASYWDIDAALAAGVGVATVHQSDFHPDDPDDAGGMLGWALPTPRDDDRWGAIGAWAYGLSRALDVLETDPDIGRVVVFGHSRRGKTALWAAAQDPRFAGVWAHQSGTGGSAVARTLEGESILAVNALFPHWFNDVYPQFADREQRLPVDQHLLLALAAPRPVRLSDGDDDAWANPAGSERAAELAAPVFTALDGPAPAWDLRPGGHEVNREDWARALAWWADHR